MSKTAKIISLVVAAVFVVGIIATIAIMTSESSSAVKPTLTVDGKKVKDPNPILTIGDTEISFEEYRYYYMSTLSQYTAYGMDMSSEENAEMAASIKTSIDDTLVDMVALLQIADERGITLTQEDHDEIDATLASTKEQLGTSFQSQLEAAYLVDEAFYVKMLEQSKLAQKAQNALTDEAIEEDEDALMATLVSAKHILIPFETTTTDESGSTISLTEDEIAANKAAAKELADSLSQQITDSEDPIATFEDLFVEYQANDAGQTEDGYTFGEGQMVDSFYQGALALPIDGISAPIESTYGYHIILRLPLDQAYVDENLDSLLASAVTPFVNEKIDAVVETLSITYGEYYDDITPSSVT